ncbi:sbcc family protein [Salinigranum halophilum]|uniref:hypothetical protein n=1 Tax=Salinigranum halophilum TaxID=2565931 RepID=UPI00115E57A5|nr:hypothetical protein [Salinigranum halophilum]
MSRLRIYNTQGYQVYPAVDEATQADDAVLDHILSDIEFYVDPTSPHLVAYVEAKAPHVSGGRSAQYFMSYVADSKDTLFSGLMQNIEALKRGGDSRGRWEFTREGVFDFPWKLNQASGTLMNVGLNSGQQLAVVRLLEEGTKLDIGIRNYKNAAIVISYLLFDRGLSVGITVSKSGSRSPVGPSTLLMKPDLANFTPLNDQTKEEMRQRYENIAKDVREEWDNRLQGLVTSLLQRESLTVWHHYLELQTLTDCVLAIESGQPPSNRADLRTDHAGHVVDIVDALFDERELSEFSLTDPELLSENWKRGISQDVVDSLENARKSLEDGMKKEVRDELESHLDALSNKDMEVEHRELEAVSVMLDEESDEDSVPSSDSVDRVKTLIENLWANEVLSGPEKREIQEFVIGKIEKRQDKLVDLREDRFERGFDRALEGLLEDGSGDEDDLGRQFNAAIRLLEDPESNAVEGPEVLSRFSSLSRRLQKDSILGEKKQTLKAAFRSKLSESIETRRARRKEELEEEGERLVKNLTRPRSDEDTWAVYARLRRAKRLCTSDPDLSGVDASLERFAAYIGNLNTDGLLDQSEIDDIRNSVRTQLTGEITQLRESKREELLNEFREKMSAASGSTLDADRSEQLWKAFQMVDRYIHSTGNAEKQRLDRFRRIAEIIDLLTNSSTDRPKLFANPDSNRDELTDIVSSEIETFREREQRRLANECTQLVEDILEEPNVDPADKVDTLDRIKQLRQSQSSGSTVDQPHLDAENTLGHADEVSEYLERARSIIEVIDTNTVLRPEQKRELDRQLRDLLHDKQTEAKNELARQFANRIRNEIHTHLDGRLTGDLSIQDFDEAIRVINAAQTLLSSGAVSRNLPPDIEQSIQEALTNELVGPEQQNILVQELGEPLEKLKTRQRAEKQNLVVGQFERHREALARRDPADRLRGLRRLKDALNGKRDKSHPQEIHALAKQSRVLNEEQREQIWSDIQTDQTEAFKEFRKSRPAKIRRSLEQWRETVTAAGEETGLNSMKKVVTGEQEVGSSDSEHFANAIETITQIRQLKREDAIHQKQYEQITSDIENMIDELLKQRSPPSGRYGRFGALKLGLRSKLGAVSPRLVVLVFVVALLAGGGTYGALEVYGIGATAGPAEIGQLSITAGGGGGGGILVGGTVNGDDSDVRVSIVGPQLNTSKRTTATNGSFEVRFDGGKSGQYEVTVAPEGGESLHVVSTVSMGGSDEQPTVDILSPTWGAEVSTQTLTVEANVTASRYSLRLLNDSGVTLTTTSGPVEDGRVTQQLETNGPGVYYVVLSATNQNTTTTVTRVLVPTDEST